MSTYNIPKLEKKLKKELDTERFRHSVAVMYTGTALAMRWGCDLERTQVAGLLHDCAKCIPNDKKLRLCEQNGIEVTQTERDNPFLLHSKLGAWMAKEKYGIEDEEILGAITWHTTGRPGMTLMEKIIFLSDYIEPMRQKAQNLETIRYQAFIDLDRAVMMTLRDTLQYLRSGSRELDENTELSYYYYRDLCDRKSPGKKAVGAEKAAAGTGTAGTGTEGIPEKSPDTEP